MDDRKSGHSAMSGAPSLLSIVGLKLGRRQSANQVVTSWRYNCRLRSHVGCPTAALSVVPASKIQPKCRKRQKHIRLQQRNVELWKRIAETQIKIQKSISKIQQSNIRIQKSIAAIRRSNIKVPSIIVAIQHGKIQQLIIKSLAAEQVTGTVPQQTAVVPAAIAGDDDGDSASRGSDERVRSPQSDETRSIDRDKNRRHRWLGNHNEYCRSVGGGRMDGRLRISDRDIGHICCATCCTSKTMGRPVKELKKGKSSQENAVDPEAQSTSDISARREPILPHLNVVIMVIGSRGEIQPFVKLGKLLRQTYGHRVRIATHPAFQDMIEQEQGLDFFSVGGEPSELLEYMVNNPGMISKLKTARFGKIGKRRNVTAEIFDGFWRSCTDGRVSRDGNDVEPFIADCIIANPASYAHIHCAEALGIPMQIISTLPSTPTHLFPHPLAALQKPHKRRSGKKRSYANFMSYPMVERKIWQGLGCVTNRFRANTLYLDRVSTLWASAAKYRQRVPHTYLWSTGLVPKPADWGEEIDVSGFVFPEREADFIPPRLLHEFLAVGETPIFISFGSVVVGDGVRMTNMIFDAVRKAGVRALVSKNWEGLRDLEIPENIHLIDDVPHDWLFSRVKACVINGDAGTTALALKHALPAMVVPFFEDQNFWGGTVSRLGAGPPPLAYRQLDSDTLTEGIMYCLTGEAKEAAAKVAALIAEDGDGAQTAVKSLQHHMSLYEHRSTRCCIFPDELAVWQVKKSTDIKLSALAAELLVANEYLNYKELRLVRRMDWNDYRGPGDPMTGAASSVAASVGGAAHCACRRSTKPVKKSGSKKKHKTVPVKKKKNKNKKNKGKGKAKKGANNGTAREGVLDESSSSSRGHSTTTSLSTVNEDGRTTTASTAERDRQTTSTSTAGRDRRTTSISTTEQNRPTTPDFPPRQARSTASIRPVVTRKSPSRARRAAWTIAKSPADLFYSISQGFHNAPVLYGDRMVRKPTRITGFCSGMTASRREFVYGFYDGFTGLVTQPVYGAKTDGAFGFVKGVCKGLGGLVVKPVSAIIGPVGYTMQGVVKQVERRCSPLQMIRHLRKVQGENKLQALSEGERSVVQERVIKEWGVIRDLQKELAKRGKSSTRRLDTSVLFANADVAAQSTRLLREGKTIEEVIASAREYENNPLSRSTSS
ncbi:hypothetical protein L249_1069 [Ophiocordyceps polyrhachis-furcata BCC 54312]|uniref:Uncharacterized protein n=1 Tax=Ophiocordyceps polyrhachis-furcata BCC 54312 TaxID=1330021 RepID=A0A367LDF3_9HYPO|nr:hypothetical protein L249_1069 [Ophiocordyceps polyrhachis-furcata BCC 54312]